MTTKILGAITGYLTGFGFLRYFDMYGRDQLLLLFTTLLAIEVITQIEKEWMQK